MKNVILVFSMMLMYIMVQAKPAHTETATFKVYGNCGMCKKRIETSLGKNTNIKSADWNVQTKVITVIYDPHAVSLDAVHKIIAEAGHDTEKVKADGKTYDGLMGCCKYERAK